MNRRIYLCGLKHSGKSTLARVLAEQFEVPAYDLDEILLKIANQTTPGKPQRNHSSEQGREAAGSRPPFESVREIYRSWGKEGFLSVEAEAAYRLAEHPPPFIAALGGGTVENHRALDALSGTGVFVYLDERIETLFRRVVQGGLPPFLDTVDPYNSFRHLCERRKKLYLELADTVVSINGADLDSAATLLRERIKEITHAGQ